MTTLTATSPEISLPEGYRVLFLDFDGVLQTSHLPEYIDMEFAGPLAQWLEKAQDVRVVVTSTHREGRDLRSLRKFVPLALRPYIIDATPVDAEGRAYGGRQRECEDWLRLHPEVTNWAAIDDEVHLFDEDCGWLIACSRYYALGHEHSAEQLRHWLVEKAFLED